MSKRIRVISSGRVIIADEEFAELHFPGDWEDVSVPPEPVNLGTSISKLAFMLRIGGGPGMDVWVKADIAGQHDRTSPRVIQERAAKIRTAKDLMAATKESVDLALPLTILQVNSLAALLVEANELSQPQADALVTTVLDTSTITEDELP